MTELGNKILALRAQGKTYSEIADLLDCSKATVAYYCGQGQKVKSVTRSRVNKKKLIAYTQAFKTSKPCMDCKNEYPYYIMQFDHRPGELKLYTISKVSTIPSLSALIDEITKCDLVCANCHAARTWERLVKSGDGILLEEDLVQCALSSKEEQPPLKR